MSDPDTEPSGGNYPAFNPKQWEEAYNATPNLEPESDEPDDFQAIIQSALDESGIPGQVHSLDSAIAHQEQERLNQENLIKAELGDESVVEVKAGDKVKHIDLLKNEYAWRVYVNLIEGYARKDDRPSVEKLINVIPDPDHSQLMAEIQNRLSYVKVDTEYDGFDNTIGTLDSVQRGTQEDLIPGLFDFRTCVSDDEKLDKEKLVNEFLTRMTSKEIDASDWIAVNDTLSNVKKRFGPATFLEVSDEVINRYRQITQPNESQE